MKGLDLSSLFRRIEKRRPLSAAQKSSIESGVDGTISVPTGGDVVREGDRPAKSTLLLSGLAIRYSMLRDGKRQITAIHVPGDFVDLHSFPLEIMDHSVGALTDCIFATVSHSTLERLIQTDLDLAKTFWMLTLLDASIHREWLVAMGGLSAPARTAHLLHELLLRLRVVGLANSDGYDFAVNQEELADVLGLSTVHMNRTLQELRGQGLLEFQQRRVRLLDVERLRDLAQFDGKYLHLRDDESF